MRLTALRRVTHAIVPWNKEPMTALAKKYNYVVRGHGTLDNFHGYMWWCITQKTSEFWPLLLMFAVYGTFTSYIIWWTFQKTEVQLNRFTKHKPWEWERAQFVFNKRKKAFYNDSFMWQRIPELDKLQAEMLEEKNKRLAAQRAASKEKH